jgi:aspartyl-tRNA(Asn)/glutamyl-tRNA(Gln) amidotransferase subunit C
MLPVPLTQSDVARLADLARIELTGAELDTLTGQLDVILDAVAAVQTAAAESVPPTSHALALVNVFRADEVRPSLAPAEALSGAPAQENGRFRVPHILEED